MLPNYILITPAKNEEKLLPSIINGVILSTKKPALWVIVDDGSQDKTLSIIKEYSKNYNFIKYISLNSDNVDSLFRYSNACIKGFDFMIDYCKINNIEWNYISVLDADTLVTNKYYEKLINKMESDGSIGISSGVIYSKVNGRFIKEKQLNYLPRGTGRLWRKTSFFDTNRYELSTDPDTVSNIKALLKGWTLKIYEDVMIYQLRETNSANGLWKGYLKSGIHMYYMNFNPLLLIINCVNLFLSKNFVYIIPYLYGYIKSCLSRMPRFDDPMIIYYNKYLRIRNIIGSYIKK